MGKDFIKSGDEKWQLVEKIRNDARAEKNNLMFILADYMDGYGAIRSDILDYLAKHPFKAINSITIINEIKSLMQEDVSAEWMEIIHDILEFREEKAIYYLHEIKRAVSTGLSLEVFREGLETAESPYKLSLFIDEKINEDTDKTEDKEQKRMLQLDALVESLSSYASKMEILLTKMEDRIKVQEDVEMQGEEEIYFDEALVPPMEFELTDSISDIEEDIPDFDEEGMVPELDDIPEMPAEESYTETEEFMPEHDDMLSKEENFAIEEQEQEETSLDNSAGMQDIAREEELPKRHRRLMETAVRMIAMEKRRFLSKSSEEQREYLIKRLFEKKAEVSKINVLKSLFEYFSNEYLYDLVVRDATEAELQNLLLLTK